MNAVRSVALLALAAFAPAAPAAAPPAGDRGDPLPAGAKARLGSSFVGNAVLSPDGTLLARREEGRLCLTEVVTGRTLHVLATRTWDIDDPMLYFVQGGKQLMVLALDRVAVQVWDVKSGRLTAQLSAKDIGLDRYGTELLEKATVSTDGNRIAMRRTERGGARYLLVYDRE